MKYLFLFSLLLLISNCNKAKTVLICGDHICINKAEADQYFEENLSIEVRIIDKKINKELDLVELNMQNNQKGTKKISIHSKKQTNENLKVLSDSEVIKIKKKIKNKKKEKKLARKVSKNNSSLDNDLNVNNKIMQKNVNKRLIEVVDVCTIIEKCSIEEISKYLLEQGKKKEFPDITKRQ